MTLHLASWSFANYVRRVEEGSFFYSTGSSRRKRRRSLRSIDKDAFWAINSLGAVVHYHLERWKPETGSVYERDDPSIQDSLSNFDWILPAKVGTTLRHSLDKKKSSTIVCNFIYNLSYLNKHVKNWSVAQVSTPGTRILVTFSRRPRGKTLRKISERL